eukprot:gb/GEZN01006430.1/.p1 GENE.gb/GEZN01006430.1/~~gb/GEZN01006430.1/.p1  ORF type:complete len:460 (+),score=71.40 gb/GEZN01006430.1/:201-1382(+)
MTARVLSTPKQTLIYYLQARLLTSWAPKLSKPFRDASLRFDKAILGIADRGPRWKECVKQTGRWLGFAMDRAFVNQTNGAAARETAKDMIRRVKTAFQTEVLESLSWMDRQTKIKAADKASAVDDMLGFPDWIFNQTVMEEYYEGVDIAETAFAESLIALAAWRFRKNLKKLGQPVDKKEWGMNPSTVNAYYNPSDNKMVFPSGILRPPFYDAEFPMYFNYGALGTIMGHELTHGFDDSGSKYDSTGKLNTWWTNGSRVGFESRAQCMVDQYQEYSIKGKHVNGQLTLGENIADNGGIKQAYLAYQKFVLERGREQPLPSLGLTVDQVFFAGMATVWCSKARDEYAEQALSIDPHSPPMYRVIGSMANSPEFAEAYDCPVGSRMNQPKKCQVW